MAFEFIINIFNGFRNAIPTEYQLLFDLESTDSDTGNMTIIIWTNNGRNRKSQAGPHSSGIGPNRFKKEISQL